MREITEVIEKHSELPVISGGGRVDLERNRYSAITVVKAQDGRTFVDIDQLLGHFNRMYTQQKKFAESQGRDMAPQASWDAGKARGMEDLMNHLAMLEGEAKGLAALP